MQHIPKSNIKTNAQSGSSQYDFLDDSLKETLADQIHHLGGIETCDWSILIATFDNFYRATDNSTRINFIISLSTGDAIPKDFTVLFALQTHQLSNRHAKQIFLAHQLVHQRHKLEHQVLEFQ